MTLTHPLILILFAVAMSCFGAAPTSWSWVNPAPVGHVNEVIFFKDRFLAFGYGSGAQVSSSTNGIDWTNTRMRATDPGTPEPAVVGSVSGVSYGNGILAGSDGWRLVTSTNGIDWMFHPIPALQVVFGKGRFVTASLWGPMWHFKNELDWGIIGNPVFAPCVAFGHGRFVAVGSSGKAAVSRDGINWSVTEVGTSSDLVSIAFFRGRFLAASARGDLFLSVNGARWRKCVSVPSRYYPQIFAGLHGFHVYDGNELLDGMRQWRVTARGEVCDSPLPRGVRDLARGKGITVAVGETVATSRNEREWITRFLDITRRAEIVGLAQGTNGRTLALLNTLQFGGGNGGSTFFETVDGTNWVLEGSTWLYLEDKTLTSVDYGTGRFVAVGERGVILTIADNDSWFANLQITNDFHRVHFARDRFFAFGDGVTLQSVDGVNWSSNNCPPGKWNDVEFGNGYYVMTFGSRFRTSTDGETWIDPNNGQCCGVDILKFANGTFYGAWGEYVFTFPYPENAQIKLAAIAQGHVRTILTGDFGVLAYGDNGAAMWSPDGTSFEYAAGAPVESVKGAKVIQGQIHVVGSAGAILRGNP